MSERPGGATAKKNTTPVRAGPQQKKKKHHPVEGEASPPRPAVSECASARGRKKKKNTTQGVLFFCSGPGERQGKEKPRAGTGPEQKKTPPRVFFLLRPRRKAREGEAPLGAGTGPEQRKKHHPGCFFLLRPRGKAGEGEAPLGAGTGPEQKKEKNNTLGVFFLLWPRRKVAAPNGAQQKKHFAHPGPTAKKILETNDAGHEQKGATTKQKHPGLEFSRVHWSYLRLGLGVRVSGFGVSRFRVSWVANGRTQNFLALLIWFIFERLSFLATRY